MCACLQDNFASLPSLGWVHSLAAGLDKLLFPALVDSKVVVTNAKVPMSCYCCMQPCPG